MMAPTNLKDKQDSSDIPLWFQLFHDDLRDDLQHSREMIEKKIEDQNSNFSNWLLKQDQKLIEIHKETRTTNGRVTSLEARERERKAVEDALAKTTALYREHNREELSEIHERDKDAKQSKKDKIYYVVIAFASVAGAVVGAVLGHAIH